MANVLFRTSPLFQETFAKKFSENAKVDERFKEFVKTKTENPMTPFGSKDAPLSGKGNFANAVPKLLHAHLLNDLIIFYKLSGANPTMIDLYGVFTHDESGTGQPANIKKQKQVAKKMASQTFNS